MRLTALWWWIDRWRKSTAYTDMTLEQQGAYRNLLDEANLRGGPLPNDERILAKACGDSSKWRRVRDVVLARFELKPDGWHNTTLDEVIREGQRRAEKQARYRNKRGNESSNGAGNGGGNRRGSPDPSPISTYEDQNKPAPKARRDAHPVENSDEANRTTRDRIPSTVRDRENSARGQPDDHGRGMEGQDEGESGEAGIRGGAAGHAAAGDESSRARLSADAGAAPGRSATSPAGNGEAATGRSTVAPRENASGMGNRPTPHGESEISRLRATVHRRLTGS